MTFKVGQDIEAICGKCGDVWHVVVAMVGSKIAKVQCKQCSGYHRYRSLDGPAKTSAGTIRGSLRTPGSSRRKKTPVPEAPRVEADPSRPPRRYNISGEFAQGDTLEHPTFGTGVVEQLLQDKKIQVFFPGGRRILAHQR